MSMTWRSVNYEADEVDANGKTHHVSQTKCSDCSEVFSRVHHYCCGHASNGCYSMKVHECPGRRVDGD